MSSPSEAFPAESESTSKRRRDSQKAHGTVQHESSNSSTMSPSHIHLSNRFHRSIYIPPSCHAYTCRDTPTSLMVAPFFLMTLGSVPHTHTHTHTHTHITPPLTFFFNRRSGNMHLGEIHTRGEGPPGTMPGTTRGTRDDARDDAGTRDNARDDGGDDAGDTRDDAGDDAGDEGRCEGRRGGRFLQYFVMGGCRGTRRGRCGGRRGGRGTTRGTMLGTTPGNPSGTWEIRGAPGWRP